MTPKSIPSSSSRSYSIRGIIAVAGVGRLPSPIALHRDAAPAPFGDRQGQRIGDAAHGFGQPVGRLVAAGLAHLLDKDRAVFDPVSVGVDDRMAEAGADFFRVPILVGAHGLLRERLILRPYPAAKRRPAPDMISLLSAVRRPFLARSAGPGGRERRATHAPATVRSSMRRVGASMPVLNSRSLAATTRRNMSFRLPATVISLTGKAISPFSIQNPAAPRL